MERRTTVLGILAAGCFITAAALISSIGMAETDKEQRVKYAMAALKAKTTALGAPKIEGTEPTGGRDWPVLFFGTTKMNNFNEVVDEVVKAHGGIATLFVKESPTHTPRFVRVSTTTKKDDGTRAIGTTLDPASGAVLALDRGESVYGVRNDIGGTYEMGYEPIKDVSGKVIGAYSVGFP
jgi:hypothetical protein